jgi:hypothetical protein
LRRGGARLEIEAGDISICVVQGDISRLQDPVDVIVSPDDNYPSAGGGVLSAIRRVAASAEIDAQTLALAGGGEGPSPLQVGTAVVTAAGKLEAKAIVHAIVIDLDRGTLPSASLRIVLWSVRSATTSFSSRFLRAELEQFADCGSRAITARPAVCHRLHHISWPGVSPKR